MLQVLQGEGFIIGHTALVRLRYELSLRRRVNGLEQLREADEYVRQLVAREL